ncbi:hypothetical protein [Belliella aquatica]|uniref:Uncharacterized protein n=1 Tax=Belliella aquatica TaxID=1323734 RepID=A0ABQ1MB67_9BACT|nr:hypothetical protein [Belliella aquatica]MCH7406336.1 hypothetical protein [Belliella aquatica]GGC37934.1 hypothetical protein GCM10010993_16070 [Belliella aquatica]
MKIVALKEKPWQYRDLSSSIFISISEISESLNRSKLAGLIDIEGKKIKRNALMEFIQHGFKYVFPQLPGAIVNGIPTAHSHSFYKNQIVSQLLIVWPTPDGSVRGQSIQPLHKGVVKAIEYDELFYKLLASLDIIRIGKVREVKLAIEELKKHIL